MSDINQHITEYLDYYLGLPNAPQYAVLLRGDWGSGKSFFSKNYIANNTDHKYLTISLYGITSFKEIEDSFFQQVHPILGSKAAKFTSKLLTGVVKGALKIDLNGDAKGSDATATINIPEFVTNFDKSAENRVLVFDDLERCNIKLTDLLGYINQYVENYGLKVIVIANEQEIIKKSAETGDKEVSEYARIKEKLIGKSFDVQADVDTALGVFIGEVNGQPSEKVMLKYKAIIRSTYDTAKYNNLRHLKQSVLDFARFYEFLPADLDKTQGLLEHIVSLFFAISIEIKKGDIQPDDIPKIFLLDYLTRGKNDDPTVIQIINAKYPVFGLDHQPFDPPLLRDFFKNGTVDKTKLVTSVSYSSYFSDKNKPTWVKLWYFDLLEDGDLVKYSNEVWQELVSKKINDKYVLLHLVGIFLNLIKLGLIDKKEEDVITFGNANLDALALDGKLLLKKHEKINTSNGYMIEYQGKSISKFRDFITTFTNAVNNAQEANWPTKAKELLDLLQAGNDSMFIIRVTLGSSGENLYFDVPILTQIVPSDFSTAYLALKNSRKREFFKSLKGRYETGHFLKELKPEVAWWKDVNNELKKLMPAYKGMVTGYLINAAIEDIQHIIQILEPAATTP